MSNIEELKINRLLRAVAEIDTEVSPEVELTSSNIDPEEIRTILFSAWDDAVQGDRANLTASCTDTKNQELQDFDVYVLTAIIMAGENAYGVPVIEGVQQLLDREVSPGAVYTTLDRLETKRLVNSWRGEPTKERGGKARRYYKVENAGHKALHNALKPMKKAITAVAEWGLA